MKEYKGNNYQHNYLTNNEGGLLYLIIKFFWLSQDPFKGSKLLKEWMILCEKKLQTTINDF